MSQSKSRMNALARFYQAGMWRTCVWHSRHETLIGPRLAATHELRTYVYQYIILLPDTIL